MPLAIDFAELDLRSAFDFAIGIKEDAPPRGERRGLGGRRAYSAVQVWQQSRS